MGAYTNRAVARTSRTRPLLTRALEIALIAGFGLTSRCWPPSRATSPTTPSNTCTSTPAGSSARRCPSGTRRSPAGTVTHQNIGYLFPQGPFYWLFAQLGVPMWVSQRTLDGHLVFAAGAGVRYLAGTLGVTRPRPAGRRARLRSARTSSSTSSRPRPSCSLVRTRLARRVHGDRRPAGRVALSRFVRARGRPRRGDKRNLADLRRHRPGGMALLRGLRPPRGIGARRASGPG